MPRFFYALVLLPFFAAPALAEPLVTDRPDIAESSQAVKAGIYQQEQGIQVPLQGGAVLVGFPSLHRFGIGHDLELRLETPIVEIANGQPAFTGLDLGAKWNFLETEDLGPWLSMGLLAHARFDRQFQVSPLTKLAIDTELPFGVGLGVNLGAELAAGSPNFLYAASLSTELTPVLKAYAEVSDVRGAGPAELGVDTGVTWLLGDDMQLDTSVYKGLAPGAPDWYWGLGLSSRWGK